MKMFRTLALGAALVSTSVWSFGQDYHRSQYQDRDDRAAYRSGYDEGRRDAESRRAFHPDDHHFRENDDRKAYREGYEAGFNSLRRGDHDGDRDRDRDRDGDRERDHDRDGDRDHDRDGDRDRDHDRDGDHDRASQWHNGGNNGGFGGYGNMSQIAQQNGYRDGMNDGQHDRQTGHSFRPTHDDNYKNAPGYSSSMGDRQQYKNMYRQAYEQAYPQGYNGHR
ncbi:MAG: hypothetical protein JOZ10_13810 [Acidobacteria bacterium]|nr:hypothetical protein [Acidobacteriota bacterium]